MIKLCLKNCDILHLVENHFYIYYRQKSHGEDIVSTSWCVLILKRG